MDEITDYGFRWGPAVVQRNHHATTGAYKGYRSLSVKTDTGQDLQISISPTGRSLRVWLNYKEMRVVE